MAAIARRLGHETHVDAAARTDRAAPDPAAPIDTRCARQMAFWMEHGLRTLFLQDGDVLVLRTERLLRMLAHVRAAFPSISRITAYARAKTLSGKSADELRALRNAGLDRIHVGMESGSDTVLALMRKGVTQEEQVRAGRRVVEAGIELCEYYMPGLGGAELSHAHALDSAAVLAAVNPAFIRIRSAVPVPGTPLHGMMLEGRWTPLSEEAKVREIRTWLEHLAGITSVVRSDHIMNLLEDVAGTLPGDRPSMRATIDRFLDMHSADRELFIVGRRIGRVRTLSDYAPSAELERVRRELVARFGSLDRAVLELLPNFL